MKVKIHLVDKLDGKDIRIFVDADSMEHALKKAYELEGQYNAIALELEEIKE